MIIQTNRYHAKNVGRLISGCLASSTLKNYIKLDVLADCIVQAGLNQFAKILGHCKPILALKSAILIPSKNIGSHFLCIQNCSADQMNYHLKKSGSCAIDMCWFSGLHI